MFRAPQDELFHCGAAVYLTIAKGSPDWAAYDLGAFGQTLMLSAKSRGIDSIPAYAFVKFPEVVRRHLGIPEDEIVFLGIGLGYATDKPINGYRSARVPQEGMLTIRD